MATLMREYDPVRYSRTAITLHWIIAALIILNLLLGFLHERFGEDAERTMMFVHKASGMTILALSLIRLLWRFGHRPPPFDPAFRPWEVMTARLIHGLFYLLMIVAPITGWMISSSSGRVTDYFGLFDIPPLPVSRTDDAHEAFEEVHELLAFGMIGLIILHVAAALKHHLAGRRQIVGRMAPWLYRNR